MGYVRAHIRLITQRDLLDFMSKIGEYKEENFIIENKDASVRVNAHSMLGVLYATNDFNDNTYLVNLTNDGCIPSFVEEYRVNG